MIVGKKLARPSLTKEFYDVDALCRLLEIYPPIIEDTIPKVKISGITVCIPNYQQDSTVERAVKSVVDSKYVDKIIVLDMNDHSMKPILEKYERVYVLCSEQMFAPKARNVLASHVTTSHIVFLDADDYFATTSDFDKLVESYEEGKLIFPNYHKSFKSDNLFFRMNRIQTTCLMPLEWFNSKHGFDELMTHSVEDCNLYFHAPIKVVEDSIVVRGDGNHIVSKNYCLGLFDLFNRHPEIKDYFEKVLLDDESISNMGYMGIKTICEFIDFKLPTDVPILDALSTSVQYCNGIGLFCYKVLNYGSFNFAKEYAKIADWETKQKNDRFKSIKQIVSSWKKMEFDFSGEDTISVIIPCWKQSAHVKYTINSVVDCRQRGIKEILVLLMDSASQSLKEELESIDPRVKCFLQPRKGLCEARNFLLKHVTSKWIIPLDADDCLLNTFDIDLSVNKKYCALVTNNYHDNPEELENTFWFNVKSPVGFYLTEAIKAVGGYSEEAFSSFEDMILGAKLSFNGHVKMLPFNMLNYVYDENGVWYAANKSGGRIRAYFILKEYFNACGLFMDVKEQSNEDDKR